MSNEDTKKLRTSYSSSSDETYIEVVTTQIALEKDHEIQYRTCSWQKTAALLFSEYISLAIMSFPYSYAVLGLIPGVLVTIGVAATVQYTSHILWKFCLKHPEIQSVCDIGQMLFWGSKWAWRATAVMFILNNTFIQGTSLHCIVGAKLLNTLSNSAMCTIAFSAITAVVCFICSLPRTLAQLSSLGILSAVTMGIAALLAVIFAAVQDHPFGYIEGKPPTVTLFPAKGMSAFLNITYTFVGQITLPSFISEMKNPKDFPKALWAVTIAEVAVFTVTGAVIYHYTGNEYVTSPAFGSLQPVFKKIAFSFAIPAIIFLGALYASVTARFVFFRMFENSRHRHSNTFVGWAAWSGIIGLSWIVAFVIAEVIPFFSDMLSVMSSLFDCWFGFIFWGMAYLTLYPGQAKWASPLRSFETLINYSLILLGIFVLGPGVYVSVQSIIDSYKANTVGSAFSCLSNAL
ncbi:transmembrane amino acid transporter protein-domain-containing protein [Hysterangium stoloniferum]|nr:transmembrane amino acid transporter protein-domain-containing protein [Hysterangium stoloniferum]